MRRIFMAALVVVGAGLALQLVPPPLLTLARYWVAPDAPRFQDGESLSLAGIETPVTVSEYRDGRYRIAARNELDLYVAQGYLQARDRLFQMDLLRHVAWGRLAEFVCDAPFGGARALDNDRFNRFIGLGAQAEELLASLNAEQRAYMNAFADGVNAWIAEGRPSLEHRLLEVEVEPWGAVDSLAVFRLLIFGLTHNYSREVRRLVLACAIGLDGAERVWPTEIEFGPVFLPPEDIGEERFALPPAIVPEVRAELAALCPPPGDQAPPAASATPPTATLGFVELLREGIAASNNWVVSGAHTASGAALLANDPHLPHMNPPLAWGVHLVLPDREVVGFTLAGLPHVVFGHNFHVAWGATTNNVDLQDLYIEKPVLTGAESDPQQATHYAYDDEVLRFDVRTETFRVRGGADVEASVRYSIHGPVLNDIDPFLRGRIPLTTLRSLPLDDAGDALAVERAGRARSADELVAALTSFDSACQSWVYADTAGSTGFVSPCRVPVRKGWQGTFPVPGWLSAYEWDGWIAKEKLPAARDPERGWLATANNRALPRDRYFTTYNNDPSPPSRYLRIAALLEQSEKMTADDFARAQVDTVLPHWPEVRAEVLAAVCRATYVGEALQAQQALCSWDGDLGPDSVGASVFMLLQNALLDATLADELPGGATGEIWDYVQSVPLIETLVDWQWKRSADDPVWDDVRTEGRETRDQTIATAFSAAVRTGVARWGAGAREWRWGDVRPFEIRHPLGGASAVLAALLNSERFPGRGAPETVFKNQFVRRDREHMHPGYGPVFRMVVDMGEPTSGGFALAGGQSGWPLSPHYGDLLPAWLVNEMQPLTPEPTTAVAVVRLVPR